jgi:hypothetical protein
MKTKKKRILVIFLGLTLLCIVFIGLNLNKIRTILSLEKVDDYPLFYMRYYGDYSLDYSIPKMHERHAAAEISKEYDTMMCSCFLATNEEGEPIFCRNLDYTLLRHPISVLVTDAPGKNASLSTVDLTYLGYSFSDPPDQSLFGSRLLFSPRVTIDGVNEYGLAVAILSVPISDTPYDPEKPTTDELGMMRLILDNARTVNEAIEKINEYNIIIYEGSEHFMIADASGDSAVIEFIDDQIIVCRDDNSWQVCTNFVLSQDIGDKTGKYRYETAVAKLTETNGILSEEEAMQLLSDISQSGTIWSVIYNLKTGETEIVMGKKYTEINYFDLQMHDE